MFASRALISPQGRFTWPARRFGLQLALVVPFAHACLRMFGYNRTQAMQRRFIPAHPTPATPPGDPESYARDMRRLVRQVRDRSPLPGACLSRSLVLWWLLRRRGMEVELCIGARLEGGRFQAHAWVERQGYPINAGKRARERYAPFARSFTKNT